MPSFKKIIVHLKSLPAQIVALLFVAYFCVDWMPVEFISFFFALSLTLKEILLFVLPVLIFTFLFVAISRMQGAVLGFILALLFCICASNFLSTMISYSVAQIALPHFPLSLCLEQENKSVLSMWVFSLPKIIENDYALFSGLAMGVLSRYMPISLVKKVQVFSENLVNIFLYRFFVPMVPFFIFGFILKFAYDGLMDKLLQQCGPILLLILVLQFIYTVFLYAVMAHFRLRAFIRYIQNMFPALIAAGTTMSSAAALPLTISGARHNTEGDETVDAIVPATVNVHLIGDSLGVPLLALAILLGFGYEMPAFAAYLVFAGYFVMIKFSVAGVPGGGIIVMLPLLEQCFHFSPEMGALITTLYILADPFNTAFNVFGNGAFAVFFSRAWKLVGRKQHVGSLR